MENNSEPGGFIDINRKRCLIGYSIKNEREILGEFWGVCKCSDKNLEKYIKKVVVEANNFFVTNAGTSVKELVLEGDPDYITQLLLTKLLDQKLIKIIKPNTWPKGMGAIEIRDGRMFYYHPFKLLPVEL